LKSQKNVCNYKLLTTSCKKKLKKNTEPGEGPYWNKSQHIRTQAQFTTKSVVALDHWLDPPDTECHPLPRPAIGWPPAIIGPTLVVVCRQLLTEELSPAQFF
jgi:hypothetical protein